MTTDVCEYPPACDSLCESSPCVGDVMTRSPTCVRPSDSVLHLVRTFHAKQFRHLLVTDYAGRLVGVVSDRDVGRCFGPHAAADEATLAVIPTARIMSTDVVTISPQVPVIAALDLMQEQGFSSLPVTDGDRLVGIITTSDLMRLLRRLLTT